MQLQLRKIENSLGIIIPASVMQQFNLRVDTPVKIVEQNGNMMIKLMIQKQSKLPFSESELLAKIDADSAHSDLIAKPIGKEWCE